MDATSGVSGDMLLGACLGAGADLTTIQGALDALDLPETVQLSREPTRRGELAAVRAQVSVSAPRRVRRLPDVEDLLARSSLQPEVREPALAVFGALADAEAAVHGVGVDEVGFHEVGALDSIADVVGVVAGLAALDVDRLVCSPIGLGGGTAETEHGTIPVPSPAVLELLRRYGAPARGGPVDVELATPTGVALLVTLADEFGTLPAVRAEAVGVGAGSRDPDGHANITRLVLGSPVGQTADGVTTEASVVLETNVDDLDPRLWPAVLAALLEAGAADAWLTPILMKKGRPAHTLSVLCAPDLAPGLERVVFTQTSTIGLRRRPVDKRVLPREHVTVEVDGHPVRVKLARLDGRVVNAVPEYDDVARVAARTERSPGSVLDAARAAAADAGATPSAR
ncbi:MAG: nickel pincer cofactor biosynthesis protein LarC [Marmoricola sp.]